MNYPIYGNNSQFFMNDLQAMRDRIDKQMQQIQQQQQQVQQPQQIPQVTQNFQLAPTQNQNDFDGRYANNIDEVKNTLVLKNTFFINKTNDTLWVKSASGDIKTYTLTEVIELDPKDKEIAELKQQINSMQEMIMKQNNVNNNTVIQENIIEKKTNKKGEK